ncbi:MAG TPA: nucleoside triphosphate pyrophosphohydrolase [Gemmatimonadales bacterium]|nr:nucleoside triphosphate pyrophosphohydrolase [Gemmatimonadales bacterium]
MQDTSALGRALAMVRDLRVRCAWDRVQTRETLRPYLVEEVLELDHALSEEDPARIRDELGDFLLHLAWQLVLGEERGEFTADDVALTMEQKMKRRHPHLFELGPKESWEKLKRKERTDGTLGGLPATLPDLLRAYRLQERAASVGFDWPDVQGPIAKVREELEEVEHELAADASGAEGRREALTDEIGDLLFAAVNLARKAGVQPGPALDRANRKFRQRFEAIERLAAERGIDVHSAGLDVLDSLWDEVKAGA